MCGGESKIEEEGRKEGRKGHGQRSEEKEGRTYGCARARGEEKGRKALYTGCHTTKKVGSYGIEGGSVCVCMERERERALPSLALKSSAACWKGEGGRC